MVAPSSVANLCQHLRLCLRALGLWAGQSWRVNAFGGDPGQMGRWWVDTPVPSLAPRVLSGVSPVCPQRQWAWCHLVLTALPPTHCLAPSSDSWINVPPSLSVRQTLRPCGRKHLGQNGLLRDSLLPPSCVCTCWLSVPRYMHVTVSSGCC